jgi:hypothetical protein
MNRLMPVVATASLLALAIPITALAAEPPQTNAAQLALRWLNCSQQQPNGQIGSGGNPIARSAEVVISLAAAAQTASNFRHGTSSLADYLKTITALDVSKTSTPVGTNGVLLVARVLDLDAGPSAIPIAQLLLAKQRTGDNQGEYGTDLFSDSLAILGLSAAHQAPGTDAITFLKNHQSPSDHGWSYDNAGAFGSDSNTSALVIQTLLASGVAASDTHITSGMQFLGTEFFNGGFVLEADPSKPDTDPSKTPDANSDELAIQAILAAGLQSDEVWSSRLHSAELDLKSRQLTSGPDTGALSSFSKLFATTEAPSAFLLRPLTASTRASSIVPLLPCPTAAANPPARPPVLARTGGGPGALIALLGGSLAAFAGLFLWRRRPAA